LGGTSEAYRTLMTNIQFASAQQRCRSLLVTSPRAGEGKSVTCANLAVTLAQSGNRVVLVSADLRRPTLKNYFNLPDQAGFSTWLTGECRDLRSVLVDPNIPNLRIMPSGRLPHDSTGLLNSPRLHELISMLTAQCDYVLFDSPPTLGLADTVILASHVDGTILIVDARSTRRSHALHAVEELQRVGGRIIGSVLNSLESSSTGYYSYYPSYARADASERGNGDASRVPGDNAQEVGRV
jgi:capsular exopolysaccharide synthesis family protein